MTLSSNIWCSEASKDCGEDPAGSAGRYDDFFFITLPLPWSRKVWESKHVHAGLGELVARLEISQPQVRVMGIVPESEDAAHARLIRYQATRDDGCFSGYARSEYQTQSHEVAELVRTLTESPSDTAKEMQVPPPTHPEREIFICTHGSRDVCCGKLGFPIYEQLHSECASPSDGKIRVWRVSHTGGHRFAPTLLDFPTGMYWGRLSPHLAKSLMTGDGDVDEFRDSFRGCAAFDPLAQIADRELFMREGWEWLWTPRHLACVPKSDESASTTIRLKWQDREGQGHEETNRVTLKDKVATVKSSGADERTWVSRFSVETRVLT